jgi:Phage terminase large subunit/Terminase RNaseH-like domain
MPSFSLNAKQQEANDLLGSGAREILLYGGSRSSKTTLFLRAMVTRALKAPGSRHAVLRFRFGHVKQSVVYDSFPKVMKMCFPEVRWDLNKSDWFATLPGDSQVWFGGLDDKERSEKVLGNEYASMLLNECSQISYAARNIAVTRLAQVVTDTVTGKPLTMRMYYDENPPDKGHWSYKLFRLKQDPETKRELARPENFACMKLNPFDNRENLPADYIQTLEDLPKRMQKRFLEGEFRDAAPNALFVEETFDKWRNDDRDLPDMLRIIVAVDPSGADENDNADNDEIGIVVCGLGIDGNGYVLEDLTCKAGPATWGKVATSAYERHGADRIVAEDNFGGAMVKHVIQSCRPNTPYRSVKASRGKVVRAEPISSLCETGKIRMAGNFVNLEDELCGFTTTGYMGEKSPNRADAMVWGMSELFPQMIKETETPQQIIQPPIDRSPNAWMHRI